MGGGILVCLILTILSNLYAVELSTLCTSPNTGCNITNSETIITNHSNFVVGGGEAIVISPAIGTFINYGDISVGSSSQQTFTLKETSSYIEHFINYGTFGNLDKMGFWVSNAKGIAHITNYGVMGSINYDKATTPLMLNNLGLMGGISINNGSQITIQNYMVRISETATTFNNFSGSTNKDNFSHLVISANGSGSVAFKDANSKIILDFGDGFEFGKEYLINKIAIDSTTGNPYSALGVDLSRLMPKSDIYLITQSGENFVVNPALQYSAIGNLYKANVRTMNNFLTISNSMIYPRKHSKSQNLGRKNSSLRMSEANVAIQDLNTNETFFYQNESQNLQTRRIKRPNKRNYSRNLNNSQNLNTDSANRVNKSQNQRFSQNLAQNPNDYYFILTPFVNHNNFAKSGNYNLSGFDYGFLTAFSGKLTSNNTLGAHFMMSYGTLGDSSDKNFHISNLNLNLGLNYKLDLVWDMYVKARGDFFYFLNQVKTLTMMETIKPNNLGFGVSVSYGKDFDFKQGGVLGIEAGLDYKALKSNNINFDSQSYQQALYNLIYADLGVNYAKYFGGFGVNLGGGFKANLAPNLAKSILLAHSQNRSFVLDNDKFLGYANVGLNYVLNARNFDMEFSLAYYGNFGDRVISNGGGFEWRVFF